MLKSKLEEKFPLFVKIDFLSSLSLCFIRTEFWISVSEILWSYTNKFLDTNFVK